MHADLGAIVAVAIAAVALNKWWYGLIAAAIATALWSIFSFTDLFDPWAIGREFAWLTGVFTVVYGAKRLVLWSVQRWTRVVALGAVLGFVALGLLTAVAVYLPPLAPAQFSEFVREVGDALAPTCSAQTVPAISVPPLPSFDESASPDEGLPPTELPSVYANAPIIDEYWDHFVGPYISIRVPDIARYEEPSFALSVVLTIVVDERGNVLAAIPVSGPKDLYAKAVQIARRWKFDPFLVDGAPRLVRIESIGVAVDTPPASMTSPTAFPTIKNWESLRIRLRHAVHGWGGPGYELTIRGDGSVSYVGSGGVALIGRHCAVIARANLERLVDEFRRGEFFSLDDRYIAQASDVNSVELSISFDGRTKRVYQYGQMFLTGVPDAATWLPHATSYAVQDWRWTRGNRFTAQSLAAERWDFSSWSVANRTMIAGVAMFGDAAAMGDLIRAGAPVYTEPEQALNIPTALEIAAQRRNIEMLRLLLGTKAAWGKGPLSTALAVAAQTVDVNLIDLLIARGADPSMQDEHRDKRTPLMNAAQGGVPTVVERLLRAKADVKVRDRSGRVALHWAVSWRDENLPILLGVDRARVVELLVAAGTDVNIRDEDGNTPLISEWEYGEEGAIALIKLGADVNARDDAYGHTPLIVCRNPKVTQLLLEAGADPYVRDSFGQNALDHARGTDVGAVLERWVKTHPPPIAKERKTAR